MLSMSRAIASSSFTLNGWFSNGLRRSRPISTTFSTAGSNSRCSSSDLLFASSRSVLYVIGTLRSNFLLHKKTHPQDHKQICEWVFSFKNLYRVTKDSFYNRKNLNPQIHDTEFFADLETWQRKQRRRGYSCAWHRSNIRKNRSKICVDFKKNYWREENHVVCFFEKRDYFKGKPVERQGRKARRD